jgi:hypothetical protein
MLLLSVFWLPIPIHIARGPHWNGSPETYANYKALEAQQKYLRELDGGLPINDLMDQGLLVFSAGCSFCLLIASYSLWKRHNAFGKVVTVVATVMIAPCGFCGVWP